MRSYFFSTLSIFRYLPKLKLQIYFILFLFLLIQILLIRAGDFFQYFVILFYLIVLIFCKFHWNIFLIYWMFISFILSFVGLINGNNFIWILFDFFVLSPILISALIYRINFSKFEKVFIEVFSYSLKYLFYFGLFIYVYMDYKPATISSSRFNFNESVHLAYFSPIMPFLFVPFLIFLYKKISIPKRRYIYFASLFIVYMGFITLSRSIILSILLPISLTLLFNNNKIKYFILVFLLVLFSLFNSFKFPQTDFLLLLELIQDRTSSQFENGDFSSSRGAEFQDYVNQNLSLLEVLFGRGFGGKKVINSSDFIGGITMMHIGWAHIFLKGGIFLVGLIYFPILFLSIFSLFKRKYYIFLMALFFLISDSTTLSWLFSYNYVLYIFLMIYLLTDYETSRFFSKHLRSLG